MLTLSGFYDFSYSDFWFRHGPNEYRKSSKIRNNYKSESVIYAAVQLFYMVSNTLIKQVLRKWRLCCHTSELEAVNQKPTALLLLILPLFTEMVRTLTPFIPMTVRCQSLFCNVWASSWKTKIKGKVVFHGLLLIKLQPGIIFHLYQCELNTKSSLSVLINIKSIWTGSVNSCH